MFYKKAHTLPQSIGGENICENVCDHCNSFFGNARDRMPSIETVIKETFNITRLRLLSTSSGIGRNKVLARFKSEFFIVDLEKRQLAFKSKYRTDKYFQSTVALLFRKGLYKVFLEETERQFQDGHNSKFDFIREFSRFGLGDYPVMYFERKFPVIMTSKYWVEKPELFLGDNMQYKYFVKHPCFFEFELLGHLFAIATTKNWQLGFDSYIKETCKVKVEYFKTPKFVERFDDVDFMLSVLNS